MLARDLCVERVGQTPEESCSSWQHQACERVQCSRQGRMSSFPLRMVCGARVLPLERRRAEVLAAERQRAGPLVGMHGQTSPLVRKPCPRGQRASDVSVQPAHLSTCHGPRHGWRSYTGSVLRARRSVSEWEEGPGRAEPREDHPPPFRAANPYAHSSAHMSHMETCTEGKMAPPIGESGQASFLEPPVKRTEEPENQFSSFARPAWYHPTLFG